MSTQNGEAGLTYSFQDLINLLSYLRDPQFGCPWDVAQTPETIVPFTIEEVCEVVEAIELKDWSNLGEELGDLLLQIVFYAQMAKEQGYFDLHQVVDRLVKKMVRRHPHVFPEGRLAPPAEQPKASTQGGVKQTWEAIKRQERAEKRSDSVSLEDADGPARPLADSLAAVPKGLDALGVAQKIQTKAARFGLDWTKQLSVEDNGVLLRLQEEVAELTQALSVQSFDKHSVAAELGDVLFTCVNLARHLELDAAQCLRQASRKFRRRAEQVEALFLAESPQEKMQDADPATLEVFWQRAKHEVVE